MGKEYYANPDLDDGFGSLKNRTSRHSGVDFAHPAGTPIPALYGGIVVEVGFNNNLGNYVQIQSDGMIFTYCHGQSASTLRDGDRVDQWQTVLLTGSTGYSNGPHLHLAVGSTKLVGFDYCVDPMPYVRYALGQNGGEELDSIFYVEASSAGTKYLWSRAEGRIIRPVSKAEWDFLRAVSTTKGGIPLNVVTISQQWLDKELARAK